MKRVIITADDLGKTKAINQGIELGHREGLITSASLLVNGEALEDALQVIGRVPGLDTGLHLNLVEGRPISKPHTIPTLIRSNGSFYKGYKPFLRAFYLNKIAITDLEREIRAQIERFLGFREIITHLDSHKHIHLVPKIWGLLIKLSREYPVKALRWPVETFNPGLLKGSSPGSWVRFCLLRLMVLGMRVGEKRSQINILDYFVGFMHCGKIDSQILKTIFNSLPNGITEIMTHPGIENDPTRKRYFMKEELEALTNPEIIAQVRKNGIKLISFRDWIFESTTDPWDKNHSTLY